MNQSNPLRIPKRKPLSRNGNGRVVIVKSSARKRQKLVKVTSPVQENSNQPKKISLPPPSLEKIDPDWQPEDHAPPPEAIETKPPKPVHIRPKIRERLPPRLRTFSPKVRSPGSRTPTNTRATVAEKLSVLLEGEKYGNALEVRIWNHTGGLPAGRKYTNKVREILYALEHNHEIKDAVMKGDISLKRLATMTTEDLASSEVKNKRRAIQQEQMEQVIIKNKHFLGRRGDFVQLLGDRDDIAHEDPELNRRVDHLDIGLDTHYMEKKPEVKLDDADDSEAEPLDIKTTKSPPEESPVKLPSPLPPSDLPSLPEIPNPEELPEISDLPLIEPESLPEIGTAEGDDDDEEMESDDDSEGGEEENNEDKDEAMESDSDEPLRAPEPEEIMAPEPDLETKEKKSTVFSKSDDTTLRSSFNKDELPSFLRSVSAPKGKKLSKEPLSPLNFDPPPFENEIPSTPDILSDSFDTPTRKPSPSTKKGKKRKASDSKSKSDRPAKKKKKVRPEDLQWKGRLKDRHSKKTFNVKITYIAGDKMPIRKKLPKTLSTNGRIRYKNIDSVLPMLKKKSQSKSHFLFRLTLHSKDRSKKREYESVFEDFEQAERGMVIDQKDKYGFKMYILPPCYDLDNACQINRELVKEIWGKDPPEGLPWGYLLYYHKKK